MKKEKAYSSWAGIRYILRSICVEDKRLLLFLLIRVPSLVLLPLCTIFLPKLVIDEVVNQQSVAHIFATIGSLTVAMMVLNILLEHTQAQIRTRSNQYYMRIRAKVCEKLVDTDYVNIESHEGQVKREKALMRNYSGDNVGVEMIANSAVNVAANLLGFFTYSSILLTLNPLILLLLIAITAINYFFLKYMNRYEMKNLQERAEYERQMNYVHDNINLQTGKDIRLYNTKKWLDARFNIGLEGRNTLIHAFVKRLLAGSGLEDTLTMIRDGIVYFYLIYLVLNARIAVSDFVLYFGAVSGFSTWISQLLKEIHNIERSGMFASYSKAFLDMPDFSNRGEGAALPDGRKSPLSIEFQNVEFTYPGAEQPTIRNFNLKIRPGEKLAVVGVNGAGKTTLVKLLCGLYAPQKGAVLINGIPSTAFNRDAYYTLFSSAFQDVNLLPITIGEDVSMTMDGEYDRERVWSCLETAGLKERVERMKDGLDTHMGKDIYPDAVELSGGEKQKLVFARALYRNAPILVLDEPTAALDPIAENQMYLQYHRVSARKTSVFISHRLSSTKFCDRIILVGDGTILEMGTHEELLALNGKYSEMFKVQSQYYQDDFEKEGAVERSE